MLIYMHAELHMCFNISYLTPEDLDLGGRGGGHKSWWTTLWEYKFKAIFKMV